MEDFKNRIKNIQLLNVSAGDCCWPFNVKRFMPFVFTFCCFVSSLFLGLLCGNICAAIMARTPLKKRF